MISINLGSKAHLCIDANNHLVIDQTNTQGQVVATVDLGLATKIRIEHVQDTLGRLYKHGVEETKAA